MKFFFNKRTRNTTNVKASSQHNQTNNYFTYLYYANTIVCYLAETWTKCKEATFSFRSNLIIRVNASGV